MTVFLLMLAVFLVVLAVLAAVADALGEPERWEARERRRDRRWTR